MAMQLYPVILAGGSGTRLWPLSRKNYPKQFLPLQSEYSLLQQTVSRTQQLTHEQTLIVSNEAHYFLCQEQLQEFKSHLTYLLEPCGKNTAAAVASAAHYLASQHKHDAIMLIMPSDHWIPPHANWHEAMILAAHYAALHPAIVTFGVQPTSAKTGYGYIKRAHALTEHIFKLERFIEKPDAAKAAALIQQPEYLWNSGMFVCRAETYLNELKQHAPDIYTATQEAVTQANQAADYIRLPLDTYATCRAESIDYAIMEHTSHGVVMPLNMPWSDLGCWNEVAEANAQDDKGNALQGQVIVHASHDCFIKSEKILVTALGLRDQIIIATADAILVADKSYSQQVKDLVQTVGEQQRHLIEEHTKVHRPWGYYEILAEGPTFKVKRLAVKPHATLSLQLHHHRAEHWVVVAGQATVVNGTQTITLNVNQSTYIPKKTRHRLSNLGQEPLYVIEVQSGDYLGEDDIIRFDDVYERTTHAVS